MSTYTKNGKELQSVTTITGACSDKSGLMKWYARMTAEYIRKFCHKPPRGRYLSGDEYAIDDEDLDEYLLSMHEDWERVGDL